MHESIFRMLAEWDVTIIQFFLMAMDQLNNGIAAIENGKTLNYII